MTALAFITFLVAATYTVASFDKKDRNKTGLAAGVAIASLFVTIGLAANGSGSQAAPVTVAKSTASSTAQPTNAPTEEPTARPTPEPTEKPTPKPDHHEERQKLMNYWDRTIMSLAMAKIAIESGSSSLEGGNAVEASQLLAVGSQQAEKAKTASTEDQPSDTSDIGNALFGAANSYKTAIDAMSRFLDDQKPSDGADAANSMSEGNGYLDDATHLMRVKFRDLGGDPMAIQDLTTQHAAYMKLFNALLGH